MARTLSGKTNFRVRVEPRRLGDMSGLSVSDDFLYSGTPAEKEKRIQEDYEDRCNSIITEIKCHVNEVGGAYIEFDRNEVCEHCGSLWTENSATYNGGCCSRDQLAEDALQEASNV